MYRTPSNFFIDKTVVQTLPISSKSGKTPCVTNQDTRKRIVAVLVFNLFHSTCYTCLRVEENNSNKRVFSEHFVNWMPMPKDPNPSLKLCYAYDSQENSRRLNEENCFDMI